jgi:hypothetical protein
VEFGMNAEEAFKATRFSTEHFISVFGLEQDSFVWGGSLCFARRSHWLSTDAASPRRTNR